MLGLSLYLAGRFADAVPRLEATRAWAPDNAGALVRPRTGLRPDAAAGSRARDIRQPFRRGARLRCRASRHGADDDPARVERAGRNRVEARHRERSEAAARALPARADGAFQRAAGRSHRAHRARAGDSTRQTPWRSRSWATPTARSRSGTTPFAALQKSIWLNPFYSAPYILLGRAYMKKGRAGDGRRECCARAIQYDPNNRSAHYLLGSAPPADRSRRRSQEGVRDRRTASGPARSLNA